MSDRNQSSYFWLQTDERNPEKQINMYLDQLTSLGIHDQDIVTEYTVNRPYNLVRTFI